MSGKTVTSKKSLQPIDRLALVVILVLSLLIGILLLNGDRTAPRVRDFSWQDKQVGAEDTGFVLTFSRPMNHATVETNLQIEPPIPGKFSWAGRRMAYTPLFPVPYGNKYQVQLKGAKDQLSKNKVKGAWMPPFTASFRTRDRAFAYVGVDGDEQGRLILYNLTNQKKTILTPPDLVVMDFKPYPDSDRILFSASDRKSQEKGLLSQQLYAVTTGISFQSPDKPEVSPQPSGRVDLVLDSKEYQNLKFDLATDGKTIVVQRLNRRNPADSGPWIIQGDTKPRSLGVAGGDFLITPDSNALALLQGQGVAIVPLKPGAKPLDFLPKFGQVLSFARDGSAAAMVKFNVDPAQPTRSLFLVTNQGVQKELLRTMGSILKCEFTPKKDALYCLLTQLIAGEEYQEEPFLAAIDLKNANDSKQLPADVRPLVVLPNQRDIQMSLSPDGLALLFDQLGTRPPSATDNLRTNEGQAIATGLLWLLPLADTTSSNTAVQVQPEQLLPGFHPQWLP
jgi:hypothetical protein